MLAQRHVNHFRQTRRESPLEEMEVAAPAEGAAPEPQQMTQLGEAVSGVLRELGAEERFVLSAYYLDQRTLLQIAGVMRVHEATVSRKLKRAAEDVRKKLLKALQAQGMSREAAPEETVPAATAAVREPRRWWLPLGFAGAAVACALVAIVFYVQRPVSLR